MQKVCEAIMTPYAAGALLLALGSFGMLLILALCTAAGRGEELLRELRRD
jgi:hypothetical protein